jgi:hypothetical protein
MWYCNDWKRSFPCLFEDNLVLTDDPVLKKYCHIVYDHHLGKQGIFGSMTCIFFILEGSKLLTPDYLEFLEISTF